LFPRFLFFVLFSRIALAKEPQRLRGRDTVDCRSLFRRALRCFAIAVSVSWISVSRRGGRGAATLARK
jgi:hypothetical protein